MRRVILESPYRGHIESHLRYVRACLRDCLLRDEAPLASHALYSGVLNDDLPIERQLGLNAGWAWTRFADAVVVYTDRGISPGMKHRIARATNCGVPVEYRTLCGEC